MKEVAPGKLVLFGSGEATATGRRIHAAIMRTLGTRAKVAVLETPAGFQPNSALVAKKLADFFLTRLGEFVAEVWVVPARRRDGEQSTNNPAVLWPLLHTNYIFMGPGSPTYTVRHLAGSLALRTILARHRHGAVLCLASAATISFGEYCLPVYEIFKAGQDLHWVEGLNLLGAYGLQLSFVTHWNNQEGGRELDTSCCFMGRERMERLLAMLPPDETVVAIDEHTSLVIDLTEGQCRVMGIGTVSVIRSCQTLLTVAAGQTFPLEILGQLKVPPEEEMPLPEAGWPSPQTTFEANRTTVERLLRLRAEARKRRDWATADTLRQRLLEIGVEVRDTPEGTLWRMTRGDDNGWSLLN